MGQEVCLVLWAFPSLLSAMEGYLRFPTVGALSLSLPALFSLSPVFGPSACNGFPLPLRQKPSLDSFKSNLTKTFFFLPDDRSAIFSFPRLSSSASSLCLLSKLCVNEVLYSQHW